MKSEEMEEMEQDFMEKRVILVDPKQEPIRIDKYLMGKLEKVTRNKVQSSIANGMVLVDGKVVKSNHKVKPNQKIECLVPESSDNKINVIPEEIPLDIRYEDEDVLVLYKPSGLVVHPGVGNTSGTLVNGLLHYFKQKDLPVMEGNDVDRPGLVHRIDKETTGLMVIAKNDLAMNGLAKQFFDHTIERTYQALVWGSFEETEGTIEGHIGRHLKDRLQMAVFPDGDVGKHAVTHYKVLEDLYYVSLVECRLETGRTHQIRVHMKYIGHTLFNDERYKGDSILKGTVYSKYKQFVQNTFDLIPRTALHAKSLGFIHPRTGEKMRFDTELPEDITAALDRWRNYVSSRK